MDLVDGHVNVLVVLVAVAGCDVLVFGEPKDVDKILHSMAEFLPVEASRSPRLSLCWLARSPTPSRMASFNRPLS
jgi:hypothetical protein